MSSQLYLNGTRDDARHVGPNSFFAAAALRCKTLPLATHNEMQLETSIKKRIGFPIGISIAISWFATNFKRTHTRDTMFNFAQLIQPTPNSTDFNVRCWASLKSLRDFSRVHFAFIACLVTIVSVSIYDSWLVVVFQEYILFDERNPVCVALIKKDPGGLSWFLAGKTLGNLFVVSVLITLFQMGYRHTLLVAKTVAIFQLCLLVFLSFSDARTGFLHFDGLRSHEPEKFRSGVINVVLHSLVGSVILFAGYFGRKFVRAGT